MFDHIINFLTFDLWQFFVPGCETCVCGTERRPPPRVNSSEGCLANRYPPRPKIISGYQEFKRLLQNDAEKSCSAPETKCEPSSVTVCTNDGDSFAEEESICAGVDLGGNEMSCDDDEGECDASDQDANNEDDANCNGDDDDDDDDDDCDDDCDDDKADDKIPCEYICRKIANKVAKKCSVSEGSEIQILEKRAEKLWNMLSQNVHQGDSPAPKWKGLKSWQKLAYYWAALSNEIPNQSPFENFKRFYEQNKVSRKRSARKHHEEMQHEWNKLNVQHRLPFIMEAFIGKVATGKVNMHDEKAIQQCISQLQSGQPC